MEQELQGNITGIKSSVLESIKGAYQFSVAREQVASTELLEHIAKLSGLIGREIAVYLNRKGQVIQVAVGDYATVTLPQVKGRKDPERLSGIRCIHTHPEAGAELSSLDLTSLCHLKLDCMAAIEVRNGQAKALQIAYLQPQNGSLGNQLSVFNLSVNELMAHPFRAIVALIDKQTATKLTVTASDAEQAVLVALELGDDPWPVADSLAELAELARTAGANIITSVTQKRPRPDPATFIGVGKARELSMLAQEQAVNCLIFDQELSPAQVRNLEQLTGCKVLDRTTLILDIFAARARTREGKIQVELAQLKHMLPRLTGFGVALSRLGGGIGTRGPGETKLETDRRHITRRIGELERELEKVKRHRALQRSGRKSVPLPLVSLVGYTNAGKSSLLNALTDADVLAEDKLFATLDPITRRLSLPPKREVLLTDTVGFIRKLPHHLVAAFRATLEEVVQADLLIHVVDASSPGFMEQIQAVDEVLGELGVNDKPTIIAFNKIDKVDKNLNLSGIARDFPHWVAISAVSGVGLSQLTSLISSLLPDNTFIDAIVPFERGDLLSALHAEGEITELEYLPHGVRVKALTGARLAAALKQYAISNVNSH